MCGLGCAVSTFCISVWISSRQTNGTCDYYDGQQHRVQIRSYRRASENQRSAFKTTHSRFSYEGCIYIATVLSEVSVP